MPSFEHPHKRDTPEHNESEGQQLVQAGLEGLREQARLIALEPPTYEGNESVATDICRNVGDIFAGIYADEMLPTEEVRYHDNKELYMSLIDPRPGKYTMEDVHGPKLYTLDRKITLFLPLEGSILRIDQDDTYEEYQSLRLEKIYLNPDDQDFAGAWTLLLTTTPRIHAFGMSDATTGLTEDQAAIQAVLRESAIEIYSGINAILPSRS